MTFGWLNVSACSLINTKRHCCMRENSVMGRLWHIYMCLNSRHATMHTLCAVGVNATNVNDIYRRLRHSCLIYSTFFFQSLRGHILDQRNDTEILIKRYVLTKHNIQSIRLFRVLYTSPPPSVDLLIPMTTRLLWEASLHEDYSLTHQF